MDPIIFAFNQDELAALIQKHQKDDLIIGLHWHEGLRNGPGGELYAFAYGNGDITTITGCPYPPGWGTDDGDGPDNIDVKDIINNPRYFILSDDLTALLANNDLMIGKGKQVLVYLLADATSGKLQTLFQFRSCTALGTPKGMVRVAKP